MPATPINFARVFNDDGDEFDPSTGKGDTQMNDIACWLMATNVPNAAVLALIATICILVWLVGEADKIIRGRK